MFYNNYGRIDFSKDQHLMSIIKNKEYLGDVEIKEGKLVTSGFIGNNTYNNFIELLSGLQGFDISIDNFFF